MNIKDIVKNRSVHFSRYRKGIMYYWFEYDGNIYYFPVPLEDIGDATLKASDKAILFMRYIRKAMEENTLVNKLP